MFCEPKTNRKKGTAYNMVLAKDGAELLIELSVIFSRKILFVSHFLFNLVPRKSILLIFVIIETLVLLIPSFSQYLFRCGEIRSAPFATTFARITSASCAAASRTSHNKRICKILKSRTSSDLELHKSARTLPAILKRHTPQ